MCISASAVCSSKVNMINGCIYRIFHKKTGKSYIGQTVNLRNRMFQHRTASRKCHLHNAIKIDGKDSFDVEILYDNIPQWMLNDLETRTISTLNTYKGYGYNCTPGGNELLYGEDHPNFGIPRSEETKKKISEAQKGVRIGYKHSEDTKKKMSETHKGKEFSVETRKKLSEAATGRQHTNETKRKLSEFNQGKKLSDETRRKMSEAQKRRRIKERENK